MEQSARTTLSTIRTVEDLNRLGELYHVVSQIDYWIECLVEYDDIDRRIGVFQEVSGFLQKIKEVEGA